MSKFYCRTKGNMQVWLDEFAAKGHFWQRMLQIAYLMRLRPETERLLDLPGLKQRIGFVHPIIGVHVRSGDGCRHGTRAMLFHCRSLAEYLPDVRTLATKYNTTRVYVATDDPQVIADTAKFKDEFTFVFADEDRSVYRSDAKIEDRMVQRRMPVDQHAVMTSTLRDIFLLAEGDYLVTHQASAMSRLALQIATERHKAVPPYISLDGPYCPDWKMCCGVTMGEHGKVTNGLA